MTKQILDKIRYPFRYAYRNLIAPKISDYTHRDTLKKNLAVKKMHAGKRCFILGSGPSMDAVDLRTLRDEQVFPINNFYKHSQFSVLKNVNYIFSDGGITNEGSQEMNLLQEISKIHPPIPRFFFQISTKNHPSLAVLQDREIYYVASSGLMSGWFDFNVEIDYTIPLQKNGALLAIMI